MLKKQETLNILAKALQVEENLIPVYAKHLYSAVFWTGIDKDKAEKVKELLRQLHDDSNRHKKMVEDMIGYVKGQDKDAF